MFFCSLVVVLLLLAERASEYVNMQDVMCGGWVSNNVIEECVVGA